MLCELDRKWDSVNLQISWLPLACSKPANSVDTPSSERPFEADDTVTAPTVSAPTVNNDSLMQDLCHSSSDDKRTIVQDSPKVST